MFEVVCVVSDRYYIDSNLKGGYVVLGYISRKIFIDVWYNLFFCSISIFRKFLLVVIFGIVIYGNFNWWGVFGMVVNVI